MKPLTAILLFSRTARDEARLKNFSLQYDSKINGSIAEELISRTIREIRKTSLPYFIISSEQQHGNNFGERFTNALEEIFLRGYENVIAIGNDAPQLTSALLSRASNVLEQNDFVFGPDKRGGVYLLGISKKSFNREMLLSIPWKSSSVYEELIAQATGNKISTVILPVLKDVNDATDLKAILREKSISHSFRHAILCLIASAIQILFQQFFFYRDPRTQNSVYRRGPPAFIFPSIIS